MAGIARPASGATASLAERHSRGGHEVPNNATSTAQVDGGNAANGGLRGSLRAAALANAMRKRDLGVPTYTVPEAAVLLSISQEYLYRLIQAGGFPALRIRIGGRQGRYVVPAAAVDRLLSDAASGSSCVEADEWTAAWRARNGGGAA